MDAIWFDYRFSSPTVQQDPPQPGDVDYAWSTNIRLSDITAPLYDGRGNDFLTVTSTPTEALAVFAQDRNGNGLYETWLSRVH